MSKYLFLLPDLFPNKSGRACLPPAGAFPRPPSQARPDFSNVALLHNTPCATASRLMRNAPENSAPQSFLSGRV
ncbi:MAG: hypothetical protein CFE33_16470 [Pseudorhodobacter sp. PARRP1]|nr:MAG: hypothetical protein CFE33_16470 [Pseudorhodobacter sp. PARRP1]